MLQLFLRKFWMAITCERGNVPGFSSSDASFGASSFPRSPLGKSRLGPAAATPRASVSLSFWRSPERPLFRPFAAFDPFEVFELDFFLVIFETPRELPVRCPGASFVYAFGCANSQVRAEQRE